MRRPLRIVSVCRSFPTPTNPSSGTFVLSRVAAIARRAEVVAIQPMPYFPIVRGLEGWAKGAMRNQGGVRILHAPMFYIPGAFKSLDAGWLARSIAGRIEGLHRERAIDLIDAHFGYPEGAGCAEVARRLGIPVFLTVRGFETEFIERPLVGAHLKAAMSSAAGVIAVSHSLRRFVMDNGVPAARVRTIHNAIDPALFTYGDRESARRSLGLGHEHPIIVSVGHLVSGKRHHLMIEAMAQVSQQYPAAQLVLIGGGAYEPSYPEALRSLVTRAGLERSVTFAGSVPPGAVRQWLRAADVFALGTAREGCCNAVLEALAVGVPVVTTPVGDNAEFVSPDVNGLLVPVDDVRAMAIAVLKALESVAWNRPSISENLHRQVGSWAGVADRTIEFFEERLGAGA